MLYEGSGTNWLAVPYSFNIGGGVTYHTLFEYDSGSVTVYKAFSDDTNSSPSASTFKLVCIPKKAMLAYPEVDLKNYEQVKAVFNLKD